jgi:[acyl-carrier-protein] S-malonyltransferase
LWTVSVTAYLFPGQGSQTADMRDEVERLRPDLLGAVLGAVGDDPFPRVDEDTRFAQPALLAASLARWSAAGAPRDGNTVFLGHSLGELAALAAAGAVGETDAVTLAATRGRLMSEAAVRTAGAMVALLGGTPEAAAALAAEHGLTVANDNAPGQIVLAGPRDAVDSVSAAAKSAGLKAMRLAVAGAFHSPAMEPALASWRAALDEVDFRRPAAPVWSCLTAAPLDDPRAALADALTSAVHFRQALLALRERGTDRFVEIGPGRVLTGLVRRTLPDAHAETIELPEAVNA